MVDLVGERFGRLTVIARGEDYISKQGKRSSVWICRCDCGTEKAIMQCSLVTGHTKSCGCFRREKAAADKIKHGDVGTQLYNSWRAMRERCTNQNSEHYSYYGGRDIAVCQEWDDYNVFRDWALSHGYRPGLTIDRISVDGDYCPDNCRWATIIDQSNNKRNNRIITVDGVSHTLAEWSRISGISSCTILARIDKYGWSAERAVIEPPRTQRRC